MSSFCVGLRFFYALVSHHCKSFTLKDPEHSLRLLLNAKSKQIQSTTKPTVFIYLAGEALRPRPLLSGRLRAQQVPDAARQTVSRHDVQCARLAENRLLPTTVFVFPSFRQQVVTRRPRAAEAELC